MKYTFIITLMLLSLSPLFSQRTIEKTLEKLNKESIPYITAADIKNQDSLVILDTRELKEYNVSHLKNAIWVGYDHFDINTIHVQNKSQKIVVYCSIGVRSENIGEKLVASGYSNVQNLYGGIFKWMEEDLPIYDAEENRTDKVHVFSKYWGKLLTKGTKIIN
ncbi:rhodanese-like domain-containing protein [Cellulophaga sp. Z1A5H]|uniref:rhodanese-like domain-containing protein n=1 Tax=Cellulophaga sp. Z1A5H TaxID=2687291 RepID=UPI0013FDE728|nr:rhodanese-like domain-containing protein [Cellulophaga sp. Z1A5H]